MDRRRFCKDVALAGLGGVLAGSMLRCTEQESPPVAPRTQGAPASKQAGRKPRMAIASGKDPAALTSAAVGGVGGMASYVSRGDVVVIKPNIGWDRSPAQAANTNPAVVATLVRLCIEAGASNVIVTDNTCNDPRRCFLHSEIEQAVKDAGGEVRIPDPRRFKEMEVGGVLVKRWPVDPVVADADVRINAPIAKHHGLAQVTLGMKNWYGAIGGQRNKLHQDVHQSSVDLAAFFKPDLVVLDAYRVLLRNGPQGGNPRDVKMLGIVAAGSDQVAMDGFGATLFGLDVRALNSVVLAEKAGLGTADFESLAPERIDLSRG